MHDFLASNTWFIGEKWWVPNEHFKKNAAYAPPVYRFIVAVLTKNFGGDVVWRTNSRKRKLPGSLVAQFLVEGRFQLVEIKGEFLGIDFCHSRWSNFSMLAKAEICEFHVALFIDENIIRLEITMDKVHSVHRLN